MLPLGLLQLIVLHSRAMLRRLLRSLRTVRGVMFLALSGSMIVLWLQFLRVYNVGHTDPETVRAFFPLWLLTICLLNLVTSAGERAIAFTPPEVDFLYPGPFTRRQLLAYKLLKSASGAVVTATLFAFLFQRYLQSWLTGGLGIFLSLLFLQLFSMAVVLVAETLVGQAHTRVRRIMAGAMIAVLGVTLLAVIRAGRGKSIPELAIEFAATPVGAAMLGPFSVFGDLVTAPHLAADTAPSLVAALLVLALLVVVVMWLDAYSLESAAHAGQRQHDDLRRVRRGGLASAAGQAVRLRVPSLPRVGGAGTIAWRQLTTGVRQSRTVVLLLFVACATLGPVLAAAGLAEHRNPAAAVLMVVVCMNFVFANALRLDFRGDLEQLDLLKSLPLHPAAVVVGQLTAPTLVLTACQITAFISARLFLSVDGTFLLLALTITTPLNVLVFAIDNALFLLFPVRTWAASAGDLQGVGRRMTMYLAKTLVFLTVCGVAVAVGVLTWYASGRSPAVFVTTIVAALTLQTAAFVPVMVTAFRKFDPSSSASL